MRISIEEVEHVAQLAHLKFGQDEIAAMARELDAILEHVQKLQELDVEGVAPTTHAVPVICPLADDEPAASLPRQAVVANAPDTLDGLVRVPKFIDDSGAGLT
ncbi:MAG: Asp-tRNA(Asn)/Glu-tRNA(Gln) amidotransferase subunit GatC [Deltaproteobacteria bacterium]|nr:Asp-tRNA(Asn)/Glu-tRNA(Gln) amidotransferase subunit GatC [Deltaproteobacteria bacterium]